MSRKTFWYFLTHGYKLRLYWRSPLVWKGQVDAFYPAYTVLLQCPWTWGFAPPNEDEIPF